MTLYWFLLVVSSLALGSMPAETVPLGRCVGASLMLVGAWVVLIQTAATATRRIVTQGMDELDAVKLLERQLDLFRWLGVLVATICLVGFRLAAAVQTWPVFEDSMTLQSLVLLAPGLLITAAVWLAEHRYGIAMGYAKANGVRVIRDLVAALIATGGWILAPVLAMLIATDVVHWSGLFSEQSSAAVMSILAVIGIPFLVPLVIRRIWTTKPVSAADREWIEPLLVSAQMKHLPVREWNTGMRVYNAVVAGFLPGLRSMIVTDRLLEEMPRRELVMVMLHEIAHVRRGHVWLRVLAMGPSWIAASVLSSCFAASPVVTVVTNLLAVVFTLLTLRWMAHATEYDADRMACRMSLTLPPSLEPPMSNQAAADRYCQALRWVTRQERSPDKASWLHPSVSDRCLKLQRWSGQLKTEPPALAAVLN